ncbi:MAG: uroporphyrinogen-III C-methyltransferase, partial [Solirubrobacterales bacterium]
MSEAPGTVYLVGAGPGDDGLMTVRAVELVSRADVILFDKLIPPGALEGAREDAELIDVGKIGGGEQVPQEVTEQLLVERALAGRDVVRLKGGDPFVFGRGGEEVQRCLENGIPVEVVPGVTAGIAAPAYAGIPVTQRLVSSAVAFVTGHENPDKPETQIDWAALAAFPGTLVFYMGVKSLPRITAKLVEEGRPASEPAAVVERGTLPGQRQVIATVGTLADAAAAQEIKAPAITEVGEVAALGDSLGWLPAARPLDGLTVAVTRARAQASALAGRLRELGAATVEASATERSGTTSARIPPSASARAVPGPIAAIVGPARARASPAITVIGGVAALGESLAWLPAARPLDGLTVAVTRARAQASALAGRLRELGATTVEAPAIRTE